MDRCARNSSVSQPHSTGTWGRSRPLRPRYSSMSPSRPIAMPSRRSSGDPTISIGTVSTVTSTTIPSSSRSERSGNRGSWHAARAAPSMASPRGITGYGYPMHPLRSLDGCSFNVTNTPRCSPRPGSAGAAVPRTSARTHARAYLTADSPAIIPFTPSWCSR